MQTPDLPPRFVSRLQEMAGEDAESWMEGFREATAVAFRVNPLLAEDEGAVIRALQNEGLNPEPINWPSGAWSIPSIERETLTHSSPVNRGEVLLQNLSSQAAVAVLTDGLPAVNGMRFLDLAAAPGGKSIALAGFYKKSGDHEPEIRAVEVVRSRFYRMKKRMRDCGAGHIKTFQTDGRFVGDHLPESFDAVLLDAPCSSEAVIRACQPDTWAHWSEKRVLKAADLQCLLLASAWKALRPGGRLLYSTCSTAPEENEAVISAHLNAHVETTKCLPIKLGLSNTIGGLRSWRGEPFHEAVANTRRIIPNSICEPFFLAVLEKVGNSPNPEDVRKCS